MSGRRVVKSWLLCLLVVFQSVGVKAFFGDSKEGRNHFPFERGVLGFCRGECELGAAGARLSQQ